MIDQHVPTIETCKLLKAHGYPQEGAEFYWVISRHDGKTYLIDYSNSCGLCSKSYNGRMEGAIAAPLCSELLERMPKVVKNVNGIPMYIEFSYNQIKKKHLGWWKNARIESLYQGQIFSEDTEAELRAKMYLWIATNKKEEV